MINLRPTLAFLVGALCDLVALPCYAIFGLAWGLAAWWADCGFAYTTLKRR